MAPTQIPLGRHLDPEEKHRQALCWQRKLRAIISVRYTEHETDFNIEKADSKWKSGRVSIEYGSTPTSPFPVKEKELPCLQIYSSNFRHGDRNFGLASYGRSLTEVFSKVFGLASLGRSLPDLLQFESST
ncbi:hypothetical protein CEXT_790981 [Caerostris extrusa]|uniref:Uncharacterized protein n=1 Tax=Caerostris extrusa TaxID=172846 RepID=A0AAV4V2L5_CAEEX|nr:hypothetical protein CEXT_790981 [Caerostris extrusa]